MTQYAPVAPLQVLQDLARTQLLGHYQLLIAPIVLHREEEYFTFFREHDDQMIIMDNGVIELGHSVSAPALAEAVKVVGANVVVLPDTIDDAKMTTKQVRYALAAYRMFDQKTDTMGVVQGTTFEECLECAESHVKAGVDWLAVPRGLTPHLGTRVPLVEHLANEYGLPIHVLGFSDNVEDDMAAAACHRAVRGIDAATPTWVDRWLPLKAPSDPLVSQSWGKRPTDFWTRQLEDSFAPHNVETARRWLRDAQTARIEREGLAGPQAQSTPTS